MHALNPFLGSRAGFPTICSRFNGRQPANQFFPNQLEATSLTGATLRENLHVSSVNVPSYHP